jgi:hypothetical protein
LDKNVRQIRFGPEPGQERVSLTYVKPGDQIETILGPTLRYCISVGRCMLRSAEKDAGVKAYQDA